MTLYGPDGRALQGPRVELKDSTVTYAKDGESWSMDPDQLLMAMARAQRDGMSHKQIVAEFQLVNMGPGKDATSPFVLEKALKRGRRMLDKAIREGREPAESKNWVLVDDDHV